MFLFWLDQVGSMVPFKSESCSHKRGWFPYNQPSSMGFGRSEVVIIYPDTSVEVRANSVSVSKTKPLQTAKKNMMVKNKFCWLSKCQNNQHVFLVESPSGHPHAQGRALGAEALQALALQRQFLLKLLACCSVGWKFFGYFNRLVWGKPQENHWKMMV